MHSFHVTFDFKKKLQLLTLVLLVLTIFDIVDRPYWYAFSKIG